jgi:hypothetical protein
VCGIVKHDDSHNESLDLMLNAYSTVDCMKILFCLEPIKQCKQTPLPESANELYRPSDRRLSAKLTPTFEDRGVSHRQRGGFPMAVITVF